MSVQELFERVRVAPDGSDERWEAIRALHRRNDRETFEAAGALLGDEDPDRREDAADILAQLGAGRADEDRPFRLPTVELLLARLAAEREPPVLSAMVMGLAHLRDERAIDAVLALAGHEDEEVRYAVVHALAYDEPRAVAALVELSRDPAAAVRDWATFTLGGRRRSS